MDDPSGLGLSSTMRRRYPDPLDHDDIVEHVNDEEDKRIVNQLLKASPHAFLFTGLAAHCASRDPLTILVSTFPCLLGLLPPRVVVKGGAAKGSWWEPVEGGRHDVAAGSLQVRLLCPNNAAQSTKATVCLPNMSRRLWVLSVDHCGSWANSHLSDSCNLQSGALHLEVALRSVRTPSPLISTSS